MRERFAALPRVVRFVLVAAVVFALFIVIEILPLHFGGSGRPWPAVGDEFRRKLPRMIAITGAIAFVLTMRAAPRPVAGDKREGNDSSGNS